MTVLMYLLGLGLGVAAFIYIISIINTGKDRLNKRQTSAKSVKKIPADPIDIQNRNYRAPGTRMCPVCGSLLEKYEALYASQIISAGGNKILIHGCRHCYKPDEDPEKKKQSDYR